MLHIYSGHIEHISHYCEDHTYYAQCTDYANYAFVHDTHIMHVCTDFVRNVDYRLCTCMTTHYAS